MDCLNKNNNEKFKTYIKYNKTKWHKAQEGRNESTW